jgi:hypothetical protein
MLAGGRGATMAGDGAAGGVAAGRSLRGWLDRNPAWAKMIGRLFSPAGEEPGARASADTQASSAHRTPRNPRPDPPISTLQPR